MYKEKHIRSIIKALSWRVTATVTTFALVWIFTGQLGTAFAIGGIEVFLKMFLYYSHERLWNQSKFGRVEVEPFVLWFTGLPVSGKTSLADALSEEIKKGVGMSRITYLPLYIFLCEQDRCSKNNCRFLIGQLPFIT